MQNSLLILGGGCAGLSLARRLSALGVQCPATSILESRSAYIDDRTWCFWDEPSAQLTHLVHHRWPEVSVSAHGNRAIVDCRATPYAVIPSSAFYDESLELLSSSPQLQLELEVSVLTKPQKIGSRWHVETSAGTRSAQMIVDTRPTAAPRLGSALLWQSFVGREIVSAAPMFQPEIAEIMHFAPVQSGRILFFYLLPFTAHRALLEVTVFAQDPLGPDALQQEMDAFILRRTGTASYTTRRSEHGILPMGLPLPQVQADGSYARAGLFSGSARPSSGYAFQRIQCWASECAAALGSGLSPRSHALDPLRMRAMDTLFLHVLRRRPEIAPQLFFRLFQKVDIAILVRFMSDQATRSDSLAIIRALPSIPFIREIFPALKFSLVP